MRRCHLSPGGLRRRERAGDHQGRRAYLRGGQHLRRHPDGNRQPGRRQWGHEIGPRQCPAQHTAVGGLHQLVQRSHVRFHRPQQRWRRHRRRLPLGFRIGLGATRTARIAHAVIPLLRRNAPDGVSAPDDTRDERRGLTAPTGFCARSSSPPGCSTPTSSRSSTRATRRVPSGSPCPTWRANPSATACAASASCRWRTPCRSRLRWPAPWTSPTSMAWSTGTSSPRTCCSRPMAPPSSRTSASRGPWARRATSPRPASSSAPPPT